MNFGGVHMRRKWERPAHYRKNVAQNAQRTFLARWEREHGDGAEKISLEREEKKCREKT